MHGGDIYRNKVELDFSVSINPLGIPKSIKKAWKELRKECYHYPDLMQEELKFSIQSMTGVGAQYIICGNGASELFPAIIRTIEPKKKVFIPVPAFSGYKWAADAGEREIVYYELKKENDFCPDAEITDALSDEIGMVILANPNNPVGNLMNPFFMERLVSSCHDKGITVVLDESFIEFAERESAYSCIKKIQVYSNLIVVRSFTKIFALPGIRLGYAVCANADLKTRIEGFLPEWNVSAIAQRAGILASRESKYRKKSRKYVAEERKRLLQALSDIGFSVYPSEVNYLLFYTECEIAQQLLERGILIRDCSDFRGLTEGYYRVAVRKKEENDRLIEELGDILCR